MAPPARFAGRAATQSAPSPHFGGVWSTSQVALEHLLKCFYHHRFSDLLKTTGFPELINKCPISKFFFRVSR